MRTQYVEVFNFRGPEGLLGAIAQAAAQENLSQSEFARRAILERIARAGVTPPRVRAPWKREG